MTYVHCVTTVEIGKAARCFSDVFPHSSNSYHLEHALPTASEPVASVMHDGATYDCVICRFHGVCCRLKVLICGPKCTRTMVAAACGDKCRLFFVGYGVCKTGVSGIILRYFVILLEL
jgi:hypothetical protein